MPVPGESARVIDKLADLLKEAEARGAAPVETWNPPHCGDIGLAIARDGGWLYRGSPIGRMALVKLFARVLRRDPDERYYLVTPAEKIDIAVEDAPFVAVELEVTGSGRGQVLMFRTNVDDVVRCGAEHPLRFGTGAADDGLKPYVRVRGRLEALVSRSLVYDLVELADLAAEDDAGRAGIWSDGAFFLLPEGSGG
ncbi:DUF1285 domain-containing protein [Hyphomicrobium sp.]|uniref:DUF1285 domain-containing protein n=1 Tax=Hyphomicrobium sp. TaxID=82 RepID=UPI003F72873C